MPTRAWCAQLSRRTTRKTPNRLPGLLTAKLWRGKPSPGSYHPLSGVVFQRQLRVQSLSAGRAQLQRPRPTGGRLCSGQSIGRCRRGAAFVQAGHHLGDLHHALPAFAIEAMREALPAFGKKIRGYDMHDAVLTGVETRTSSPVKIARGANFQSVNTRGLYPAGEGASYAGGILSAGVDEHQSGRGRGCRHLGGWSALFGHAQLWRLLKRKTQAHTGTAMRYPSPIAPQVSVAVLRHGAGGAVVQHLGAICHQRLVDLGRHHLPVCVFGDRTGQPRLARRRHAAWHGLALRWRWRPLRCWPPRALLRPQGWPFCCRKCWSITVFDRLRQSRWWRAPLVATVLAAILDTCVFWAWALRAKMCHG